MSQQATEKTRESESPGHDIIRLDAKTLSIDGAKYEILTDYKNAFDLEVFSDRYTDFFEKYDYIVGDIAYDLLRLRGFYSPNTQHVPMDMDIWRLEDYLLEYCNFDTAYFVLKRLDEKKVFPDYEKLKSPKKQKNRSESSYRKNKKRGRKAQPRQGKGQSSKRGFSIKKKETRQ